MASDEDIARHVLDALEDQFAQPLDGLGPHVPDGFESFSELEISLSEWSYGYGVAWALVRTREPFLSSTRVAEVAAQAVATAWRTFSEASWRNVIAEDRDLDEHKPGEPDQSRQLDEFMGGLARARPLRRPRGRGDGPPEPGES